MENPLDKYDWITAWVAGWMDGWMESSQIIVHGQPETLAAFQKVRKSSPGTCGPLPEITWLLQHVNNNPFFHPTCVLVHCRSSPPANAAWGPAVCPRCYSHIRSTLSTAALCSKVIVSLCVHGTRSSCTSKLTLGRLRISSASNLRVPQVPCCCLTGKRRIWEMPPGADDA